MEDPFTRMGSKMTARMEKASTIINRSVIRYSIISRCCSVISNSTICSFNWS